MIRKIQKRRRLAARLYTQGSLYPRWHPLGQLNSEKVERYFSIKSGQSKLPVQIDCDLFDKTTIHLNKEMTSATIAPTTFPSISGTDSVVSKEQTTSILVEIGPGGVPPSTLKTVRRRALTQLQACEMQLTNFRSVWLKNGGKEDGIRKFFHNFHVHVPFTFVTNTHIHKI